MSYNTDSSNKRKYTPNEALIKIQNWCAYQERAQQEVRNKLYEYGLFSVDVENIIVDLIVTNFLNEERFANAFVGGKFRIKKWGKNKIKAELRKKRVSEVCIKKALLQITFDDYTKTLNKVLEQKRKLIKEKHPLKIKYKLMQYLIGRGFESDLVREVINDLE